MATDLPDNARMTDEEVLARESGLEYCRLGRGVSVDALLRGSHLRGRWT
jgi:hypothetical protein